jgi:uncharacterized Zn finger protein
MSLEVGDTVIMDGDTYRLTDIDDSGEGYVLTLEDDLDDIYIVTVQDNDLVTIAVG